MAEINRNTMRHLAQLSSLQLTDEEVESLQGDLEHIVDYIEALSELDTENVPPTFQVTSLENVWREDDVRLDDISGSTLVALSPDSHDNQIKVPKVL